MVFCLNIEPAAPKLRQSPYSMPINKQAQARETQRLAEAQRLSQGRRLKM